MGGLTVPHIGSKKELRHLRAYLTHVREVLRLQQWNILISDEAPEEEDAHADCLTSDNHYSATIRFQPGWQALTPRQKKDTCVHELLHLLHRDEDLLWSLVIKRNSQVSVGDALSWTEQRNVFKERMVSNMTRLVEPRVRGWDEWDDSWPLSPDVYVVHVTDA